MNITYEDIKTVIKMAEEKIKESKYIAIMSENTKRRLTHEQLKEIERCAVIKTVSENCIGSEETIIVIPSGYFDFKPYTIDISEEN